MLRGFQQTAAPEVAPQAKLGLSASACPLSSRSMTPPEKPRAGTGFIDALANWTPRAGDRPLADPEGVADRLVRWVEEARRAGRTHRADALLVLAWVAYDTPKKAERQAGEAR